MDKIPFSVYDFFAYLSSGSVLVATADYIFGMGLLQREKIGPALGVVLVVLTYVLGQIVAHCSSAVLEHGFVVKVLKRPSEVLLGATPRWKALAWVFPNYFRPLPLSTQDMVTAQMASRGCRASGEALFLHAYATVTTNDRLQARLDEFRNQYGFARNMAFAFFTSAISIVIALRVHLQSVQLRWALLAGSAGVILLYRYLKFFQQYSYELFLRYAGLPLNTKPIQGEQ